MKHFHNCQSSSLFLACQDFILPSPMLQVWLIPAEAIRNSPPHTVCLPIVCFLAFQTDYELPSPLSHSFALSGPSNL